MKKVLFSCSLLVACCWLSAFSQKKTPDGASQKTVLDLEHIWASPTFAAKGVYGIQMLQDGEHYAQASGNMILRYGFTKAPVQDTLFSPGRTQGLPAGFTLEDYKISPKENYILLQTASRSIYRHSAEAQYYIYSIKKGKVKAVNEGKPVFYATISPDEAELAYVYQNNLYLQYFRGDSTVQVTHDGQINKIINGKTDWVYEEEFGLVQGFAWSPAGDRIAYYKFDESRVKEYELPYYDSTYPTLYKYKYPKAGEENSVVSVWLYDLTGRKNTKLALGEENDQYIPRIKWTSDNNILSIERLNRRQNNFELLLADAGTGQLKPLYTEKNNTYIDITDDLRFLKDNSFVISSEKSGYNHLYYFDNTGTQVADLTPGEHDVDDIVGLNESKRLLYYRASEPGPEVKNIFSVTLNGGTKEKIETATRGSNTIQFSANYQYYILTASSTFVPPDISIYNSTGEKIRTLEDNQALRERITGLNFSPKELIIIPVSDDVSLSAWMITPPNMKKGKKYPVLFSIYGGPGHQMVTKSWGGSLDIWHQYLASQGYVVVSVDNRGTGGRGAEFKRSTYKQMGYEESDDQIAAAKYLAEKYPFVDKDRIGIYGWSFGGYLSSMSMMRSKGVFKLAVSVAPVTDWRFYDNIYTERYMQRPQDNPDGYLKTSVLSHVEEMQGKLLLIHGAFDDNVHPQNSFMLINELIKNNKNFDSEFYPNKNHSIYGGNTRYQLYSRITKYLLENL